jgi:hypothetical protein
MEKYDVRFDGIVYVCRKPGGCGVVFGDSEQMVFGRAKTMTFAHTRLVSSTNVWRGKQDYDAYQE